MNKIINKGVYFMETIKLDALYNDYVESIEKYDSWIKEKKGDLARIISGQIPYNEFLGIIEMFYKRNIVNGRKCFYVASKMKEWEYNKFLQKTYNIYNEEVTTYSYEILYFAILSGNKKQRNIIANYLGSFEEEEKEECNLVNTLLGYSLKYVVLDDTDNAIKYINQLEENKSKRGMKQIAEGHARALKGLIERNEKEFNKGLEFMLKHHVARMKRDGRKLEQYFAFDSVALAMLAKEREINITVEHELLPKEYLEDTDIDYSSIEVLI